MTTGRGTTHAGLTAAAVKEGTQWTLSAGALPMANGGMCCIDEFGDVPAAERVALLEAMEQQIISVAKVRSPPSPRPPAAGRARAAFAVPQRWWRRPHGGFVPRQCRREWSRNSQRGRPCWQR